MELLNSARISIDETECNGYLKKMKQLEKRYNSFEQTPVYDQIMLKQDHIFMDREMIAFFQNVIIN